MGTNWLTVPSRRNQAAEEVEECHPHLPRPRKQLQGIGRTNFASDLKIHSVQVRFCVMVGDQPHSTTKKSIHHHIHHHEPLLQVVIHHHFHPYEPLWPLVLVASLHGTPRHQGPASCARKEFSVAIHGAQPVWLAEDSLQVGNMVESYQGS